MKLYVEPTQAQLAAIPDDHVETDPAAVWEKAPHETPFGDYDTMASAWREGYARLPLRHDPETHPNMFKAWHHGRADSIVTCAAARAAIRRAEWLTNLVAPPSDSRTAMEPHA